jgi:hypothetical protein
MSNLAFRVLDNPLETGSMKYKMTVNIHSHPSLHCLHTAQQSMFLVQQHHRLALRITTMAELMFCELPWKRFL